MPEFAPVINVSALNGSDGFRLDGASALDYSGRATAGGGDVNGDGFADLLIGAPLSNTGGGDRGLAWVVFGAASSPAAQGLGLRVAAGSAYRFQGEAALDNAGSSIANAGDVDGDGFDDLIVGARYADPDVALGNRGASYLVFGGVAKLEAADAADGGNDNLIALANLAPATGFRFDGGANGDNSGFSVSGAGDVNGDGFADLLIGAPYADPDSGGGLNGNEGASYIVFGGTANLADLDDDDGLADGRIDLALISAGQGLRLVGATAFAGDQSGFSVALVGDVNGDGFADALTGAGFADPNGVNTNEGAAYLVFGRAQAQFTSAELNLASLTGLAGTRFDGVTAGDLAGRAVNGLGDVNGDGFADIVIGALRADPSGSASGSAYVVFGKSGFGASNDLSALNGANGFRLDGLRADDYSGFAVSAAGDVNGDGFGDILVGAQGFDRLGATYAGAAYVVLGKASGFAAAIDLGALDGNSGFRIEGAAADDRLGVGAAGAAGDVNGDGFDDIAVGADLADNNALNNSGSTYIVYGHRAVTSVVRAGTGLSDAINGGKGDDAISGLDGNDNLKGWEGDDTMLGGAGNDSLDGGGENDQVTGGGGADVFFVSAGDDTLGGGSGADTLSFRFHPATAVTVNLAAASFAIGTDTVAIGSFENVVGTILNDALTGNARVNSFTGSTGNDTLNGGAGNDNLAGSAGNNSLTGGSGLDSFFFNSALSAASNLDSIADFAVADDTMRLDDAVFAGIGLLGTLAAAAFRIGAAAADASDRVVYNSATGALIHDSNGNAAGGATQFATLATGLAITNADFIVI